MKRALIIVIPLILLSASISGAEGVTTPSKGVVRTQVESTLRGDSLRADSPGRTSSAETYTVRKGDSLYSISRRLHVSISGLKAANGLSSNALKPGKKLIIPDGAGVSVSSGEKHPPRKKAEKADAKRHTVKRGETLSSIAKRYSVSVSELRELNGISDSRLKPGQKLILKRTGPRTYAVKKGDTLIATPAEPVVTEARIIESLNTVSNTPNMDIKERLRLIAEMMRDIPYKFGGSSFKGMDCSAYVQKVFGFVDILLPRAAREQFKVGIPISKEELSIGDLVFFRTYAKFPSHVGIYLRDNLFIHASSKGKKVTIDSLDTPYYTKRFIGAKRLIPEAEASEDAPADEEKPEAGNI